VNLFSPRAKLVLCSAFYYSTTHHDIRNSDVVTPQLTYFKILTICNTCKQIRTIFTQKTFSQFTRLSISVIINNQRSEMAWAGCRRKNQGGIDIFSQIQSITKAYYMLEIYSGTHRSCMVQSTFGYLCRRRSLLPCIRYHTRSSSFTPYS
jgi:hypothetical protein